MLAPRRNMTIATVVAVLLTAAALSPAAALPLVFSYSTVFNGVAPTSAPPWLIATFTQSGANTVDLALQASLETASEFAAEVAFNLNPVLTPSSLGISYLSGDAATSVLATTQNAQSLVGSGNQKFDILFDFPTSPPAARLKGTDVSNYRFTLAGLTPQDFDFVNSDGYPTGAHIQGIPLAGGTTSGAITATPTVPIPEATTALLLGLGLVAIGGAARKRQRRV